MKITIAHLFNDILNLYGESGNVLALKYALESQNIEVNIKNISIDQPLDLSDVDFIYMGAGTEQNQKLALDYLLKHSGEISQAILANKFFFVTGNSIELFGKEIKLKDESIQTLGLFEYFTEKTEKRLVAETVFKCEYVDDLLLGFENHEGKTINSSNPLFEIIKGYGSLKDGGVEGFKQDNFYATYMIGPILARNPKLLSYITKELILYKDKNFEIKEFNLEIPQMAHDKYLEKYTSL